MFLKQLFATDDQYNENAFDVNAVNNSAGSNDNLTMSEVVQFRDSSAKVWKSSQSLGCGKYFLKSFAATLGLSTAM